MRQEHPLLGRFGHHPAANLDFLAEVEEIETTFAAWKTNRGLSPLPADFDDRVWLATAFRVGGDVNCVLAMQRLRGVEAEYGSHMASAASGGGFRPPVSASPAASRDGVPVDADPLLPVETTP